MTPNGCDINAGNTDGPIQKGKMNGLFWSDRLSPYIKLLKELQMAHFPFGTIKMGHFGICITSHATQLCHSRFGPGLWYMIPSNPIIYETGLKSLCIDYPIKSFKV